MHSCTNLKTRRRKNRELLPHPPFSSRLCAIRQKPFREFSRKKQQLLAWSLRDPAASGQKQRKRSAENEIRRSKTVPSRLGDIGADICLITPLESSHRRRNRLDVDVDTVPNLEPYRREVAALQPITFGHRPVSASRMFNPSTMTTSCGSTSCSQKVWGGRTGAPNKPRRFPLKRARRSEAKRTLPGRVPGLSAPMLKELLLGKKLRQQGGEARGGFPTSAAAYLDGDTCGECPPRLRGEGEGGNKRRAKGAGGLLVPNQEDQLTDASASEWRSSLDGFPDGKGGLSGDFIEEKAELRRIFTDTVRPKRNFSHPILLHRSSVE